MKKLKTNQAIKAVAVILSILLTVIFAVSAFCVVYIVGNDAYENPSAFREKLLSDYADNQVWALYHHIPSEPTAALPWDFQAEHTNLRFTVKDSEGKTLLTNETTSAERPYSATYSIEREILSYSETRTFETANELHDWVKAIAEKASNYEYTTITPVTDEYGSVIAYTQTVNWTEVVREKVYFNYGYEEPFAVKDAIWLSTLLIDLMLDWRWELLGTAIVSLIGLILLIVYLCISIGHRREREGVTPNRLDRIPIELFLAGLAGAALLVICALDYLFMYGYTASYYIACLVIWLVAIILLSTLFISFVLTLANRIKCRTFFKSSIICRLCCAIGRLTRIAITHLPLFGKTAVVVAFVLLVEVLALCLATYANAYDFLIFCVVVCNLLLIAPIFYCVVQFKKLTSAASRIVSGDTTYQIDTTYMVLELKAHAETLNGIGEALQKAVDERMKSERFKTELITNVSHDIKTPLTSIINYVDLLGKEEIESETVKEYVEVLSRQSARLKKLIEDLVEASKASTGNLAVNQEVLDLNLLVSQMTAEFEDKLVAKEIETVTTLTQAPATVRADGRLMWRVFENLMSNVCKYAQAHTRLYISTETVGDRVRVTMKNTSQYALNVTGEELIERFTRWDASRHTEGSGLGLSIASSLVELQGGSFAITIDGDLFKVMVNIPRA